jgi:hypothetical protein
MRSPASGNGPHATRQHLYSLVRADVRKLATVDPLRQLLPHKLPASRSGYSTPRPGGAR